MHPWPSCNGRTRNAVSMSMSMSMCQHAPWQHRASVTVGCAAVHVIVAAADNFADVPVHESSVTPSNFTVSRKGNNVPATSMPPDVGTLSRWIRVPKKTPSVFDGFSSSLFSKNHRQMSSTHSESVLNGSVAERGQTDMYSWMSSAYCW